MNNEEILKDAIRHVLWRWRKTGAINTYAYKYLAATMDRLGEPRITPEHADDCTGCPRCKPRDEV